LQATVNWSVKGTDIAIRALSNIKDEVDISIIGYGIDLQRIISNSFRRVIVKNVKI
jgi:hypothetical protein